jgi:hypothetical protein
VNLDRPVQRLLGLATLLACFALYDPDASSAIQRLALPLLMAFAAWALVQNLAAVALAVAVLGMIHLDLANGDWIDRIAWPMITLAAILTFGWILIGRFRQRIRDTHEARWQRRRDS